MNLECSNYCWREANRKTPNPDYPGQQAVSFSFLWLCFISDQKTLPAISHTHQSIDWEKDYDKRLFYFTSPLFLLALKKTWNFMAPFYGWGSTASRLQPLRGGSLLFTIQFPEIPGTHFINLGRMKGWVDLGATQWFCTRDSWIGNPAP